MSGFKLLAIRPLENCDKNILKNLIPGSTYQFNNNYKFHYDEKDNTVSEIGFDNSIPEKLYGENINITAVVGKNGSGKSTIVELLSLFIFCLSNHLDLINIEKFKKDHSLNTDEINRLQKELDIFQSFNCELYFIIEHNVICLKKQENIFMQSIFEKFGEGYKINKEETIQIRKDINNFNKIEFLRDQFFYSILANYSLYGLNTNETGLWLKSIFHKNDGYQAPIVVNPMRTEGDIDINRLTYLSKSRLLNNIFRKLEEGQKEQDSLRNLVSNKIAEKLILKLDLRKFQIVEEDNLKSNQNPNFVTRIDGKAIYLENTDKFKQTHLLLLIKAFFPDRNDVHLTDTTIKKLAVEYILSKARTIVKKYPEYSMYANRVFRTKFTESTVKSCFAKLAGDFTHSTYKLRQAINFLIHNYYTITDKTSTVYLLSTADESGIVDIVNRNIDKLRGTALQKLEKDIEKNIDIDRTDSEEYIYNNYNLINYLPPSFFEIDIEFKDKGYFKDLSSGEKQMIYSINSLIYHLLNLKSITSEERISYKYFNIILDEIELYFHPEFQRMYVYELLRSIASTNIIIDGLNIIFLTHSPFILSDISASNILRLDDGRIKISEQQSFGANVHDLLANDFFLESGFMGEFAKNEINRVIDSLNYRRLIGRLEEIKNRLDALDKINKKEFNLLKNSATITQREIDRLKIPNVKYTEDYCRKVIDLVGEPMLAISLMELHIQAYPSQKDDFIQYQIDRLEKLRGL